MIGKKIRRILIILASIIISIIGVAVFKITNNILGASILVIMLSIILCQYIELQKDKETLKLLRIREKQIDKEIEENLFKFEKLNKIETKYNGIKKEQNK